MFILGVTISIFGVLMTMYIKGVPFMFLKNPAAIFIIVVSIIGILTATQNFRVFWIGLKAAALPKAAISESEEDSRIVASLFRLLSKTTALAMALCVIISIVAALGSMNDIAVLTHAMRSALSVGVIGLILIAAVFEPIVVVLKKRQSSGRERKPKIQE